MSWKNIEKVGEWPSMQKEGFCEENWFNQLTGIYLRIGNITIFYKL